VATATPANDRAAEAAGSKRHVDDGRQMSSVIVQYVGYTPKALTREYTFHVREAGEEREFKLNIANEAFVTHRVQYQDAPAICSARLQAELTAFANHPPETQYEITAAELDNYRKARTPAGGPPPWKKKGLEDY